MGFPGHGLAVIFKSRQDTNTQLLPNKRYNAVGSMKKILNPSTENRAVHNCTTESQTVVISAVLLDDRPIRIIKVKVARQIKADCSPLKQPSEGATLLDQ